MAEDNNIVGIADTGTVVGAPLPQDQTKYVPRLAGAGPEVVATILNPLPSDFRFQHARSIAQVAPLDKDRQFAEEKGGLSMRKDQGAVAHYAQYWILKAGESKNLPGDIAQKAVQDLVNHILMERAGKGQPKQVADGFARKQVEDEIILNVNDNVSFMNALTPQEAVTQDQEEIARLNPPALEEPEVPKDPEPGKGSSYTPDKK